MGRALYLSLGYFGVPLGRWLMVLVSIVLDCGHLSGLDLCYFYGLFWGRVFVELSFLFKTMVFPFPFSSFLFVCFGSGVLSPGAVFHSFSPFLSLNILDILIFVLTLFYCTW